MTTLLNKLSNIFDIKSKSMTTVNRNLTVEEMVESDLKDYTSVDEAQVQLLIKEFGGNTITELKQNIINEAHMLTYDEFVEIREAVGQATKCITISILY